MWACTRRKVKLNLTSAALEWPWISEQNAQAKGDIINRQLVVVQSELRLSNGRGLALMMT